MTLTTTSPSTLSPAPEVGAELTPLVRDTGLNNWNRYAAVNYEFVPIHMDDEAGRAAGMGGAFGMGNLQWSYLHVLLRDWLGEHGRIRSVQCDFRTPNTKGVVTARGTITEVSTEGSTTVVTLEIWTENADGKKMAPGTAVVEIG
jgi:acyl dehydratase